MRKKKELKEGEFDKDRYCTPSEVLDLVRSIAPIVFDPCSDPDDVVGAECGVMLPSLWNAEWGDPPANIVLASGLELPWAGLEQGLIYINPPYSDPGPWVRKALTEVDRGVMLLPGNPDIGWFHTLCKDLRTTVLLMEGRLHFLENGKPATSPRQGNVLAVISSKPEDHKRFREVFTGFGVIVERPDGAEAAVRRIDGEFPVPRRLTDAVVAFYDRVLGRPSIPARVSAIELACECLERVIQEGHTDAVSALENEKAKVEDAKHERDEAEKADRARVKAEALLADVRERIGKALKSPSWHEMKAALQVISDECGGIEPPVADPQVPVLNEVREILGQVIIPHEQRIREALQAIQKARV